MNEAIFDHDMNIEVKQGWMGQSVLVLGVHAINLDVSLK